MKNIWKYLLILTFLVALWNQAIVSPFRELSLIFHKVGHALASSVFGFGINAFGMMFESSGDKIFGADSWMACFIIANSGYISSLLFSLIILFLKKTKAKKFMVGSITIMYLAFSIAFVSSIGLLANSLIFSAVVILILMIQKDGLDGLMIDIIGISIIAYIIYDTFVDTILLKLNGQLSIVKSWGTEPPGDIVRLAELTGIPTFAWGLIWLVIAVLFLNIFLIKVNSKK